MAKLEVDQDRYQSGLFLLERLDAELDIRDRSEILEILIWEVYEILWYWVIKEFGWERLDIREILEDIGHLDGRDSEVWISENLEVDIKGCASLQFHCTQTDITWIMN